MQDYVITIIAFSVFLTIASFLITLQYCLVKKFTARATVTYESKITRFKCNFDKLIGLRVFQKV